MPRRERRRPRPRAVLAGALLAAGCAGAAWWAGGPQVRALADAAPGPTRFMRDRAGALGVPVDSFRAEWLPLEHMSPALACAVVKAEDRAFFRHGGVDWAAARAALRDGLAGERLRGASTLTQQLARNLYLSPERTMWRKAREARIALRLEDALSKRRILELYLNTAEWGGGAWGVQAASRHYLGRPAQEADAFGAALLASLLAAPDAELAGPNRARARRVQERVLRQLHVSGIITDGEWIEARQRMEAFHAALDAGDGVRAAVRRMEAEPRLPAPVEAGPGLAAALASGCGLDRELAGGFRRPAAR